MADITLRDRDGTKVNYPGITSVKLNTVDGGTAEFVDADSIPEAVENSPITLDFSGGGDQVVEAPDGYVVKSAIIEKPETLIPGNIADGVEIAGIVGALVAGGGGATMITTTGKFTGTGAVVTVNHGLGCIPDIVILNILFRKAVNDAKSSVIMAVGFTQAFKDKAGVPLGQVFGTRLRTSSAVTNNTYAPVWAIDDTSTNAVNQGINSVTAETFRVGSDFYITNSGLEYTWLAIGGLT